MHLEIVYYNRMVLELQVQPRRVCFSQGMGVVHLEIVKHNKMVLELQVRFWNLHFYQQKPDGKASFSEFPVG